MVYIGVLKLIDYFVSQTIMYIIVNWYARSWKNNFDGLFDTECDWHSTKVDGAAIMANLSVHQQRMIRNTRCLFVAFKQ